MHQKTVKWGLGARQQPAEYDCALLVAAETREVADLDGLVGSYRIAARFCRWKDRGVLLATGVYEKGAVKEGIWLEQAKEMGMEI